MPPSNKKKKLNSIIYDNTNINNNATNINTNINTNNNTEQSNNTEIKINGNENNNYNNTEIIKGKAIDNFFGIIIEKPPSPINILISDETLNVNADSNIHLDLQNNIQDINNTNNKLRATKNIIYSNIELKNKIELLSEHEVLEIFRIIKNNKEKYSTNNNGIFINISTLKKVSIQEISNFILFCENNNKILEKEEEQRKIYRELVAEN